MSFRNKESQFIDSLHFTYSLITILTFLENWSYIFT